MSLLYLLRMTRWKSRFSRKKMLCNSESGDRKFSAFKFGLQHSSYFWMTAYSEILSSKCICNSESGNRKFSALTIRIATFQILLDDCVIGNSQLEMYVQFYQCNGIEPNVISLTKLPQFFFIQQRKFLQ